MYLGSGSGDQSAFIHRTVGQMKSEISRISTLGSPSVNRDVEKQPNNIYKMSVKDR